MAAVEETLGRVPLFARVKPKDLKKLGKRMQERSFSEGEVVTAQGDTGLGFFVIEDGNASVSRNDEVVRNLGPGDYFGEVALIDEGPRSATVVATSNLRCRGMTAWEFKPFVEEHPDVAWTMLETLVGRLREAETK